jgi:hypothetical protein
MIDLVGAGVNKNSGILRVRVGKVETGENLLDVQPRWG